MGSSRTRARTCVPCIGRRILNHCATREVPSAHVFKKFNQWSPAVLFLPLPALARKKTKTNTKKLRTKKAQDVASALGRMGYVSFGFVLCLSCQAPDWSLSFSGQRGSFVRAGTLGPQWSVCAELPVRSVRVINRDLLAADAFIIWLQLSHPPFEVPLDLPGTEQLPLNSAAWLH